MTKAQAFDWLEKHPGARPRTNTTWHPPQWRVFGQHNIVYWGRTLLEAISEAEKARTRNPGHRR